MSPRGAAVLAAALALAAHPVPAEEPPITSPDAPVERVEVTLVEVVVRASDRKGSPVADLAIGDLELTEGGDPRRIAYLEPLMSHGRERVVAAGPPATLYDDEGKAVTATEDVVVLPPKPARRIVFAFDVANSKIRARGAWRDAALAWVEAAMQPGDRAGVVVFRTVPEWIQPLTPDREAVRRSLAGLDLEGMATQRDRRSEMSRLFREMSACAESAEAGGRRPTGAGGGPAAGGGPPISTRGRSDETDCAFEIAEPWVAQWTAESRETIACLRTLAGQLAAVEGRKEIVLFSDGIVPDPPGLAAQTMLAVFGADRVDFSNMMLSLRDDPRDPLADLSELHDAAKAAGVVFSTFDTRQGADRGRVDNVEFERPISFRGLGVDPWAEVYDATASTLSVLAEETGGRSYRGTKDLAGRIEDAAAGSAGVYVLGFYRPQGAPAGGKIRIKTARKGVDLAFAKTFRPPRTEPLPARLDLSVRPPERNVLGDRQFLPIVLDVPLRDLPLRKSGGTWGCQLGVFVQAARPDGTVFAEVFHDATAARDADPREADPATLWRQLVRLDLPPGPYRIRARVTDDRQRIVAERRIDLTLLPGEVRGGL